ncbi:hypothetical protein F2Q68_00045764 [Brassica cretica]|uniref:Uncharacterized protein n=1 Tax=Brassica cretica TaxID=69181 RepID=A0A8S9LKG1_BRACR|nr:hypothetical protein F2Q68_00045764 [Brassica cretica]
MLLDLLRTASNGFLKSGGGFFSPKLSVVACFYTAVSRVTALAVMKRWGLANEREMKNSAVHCAFRRNNMLIRMGVEKIFGIVRGSEIYRKDQNHANGPRSSRWLVAWDQNVVSTVQQAECLQKLEVSPCMEAIHAA